SRARSIDLTVTILKDRVRQISGATCASRWQMDIIECTANELTDAIDTKVSEVGKQLQRRSDGAQGELGRLSGANRCELLGHLFPWARREPKTQVSVANGRFRQNRTLPMPWRFTLLATALALPFPVAASAADALHNNADLLKQNFLAEHEIGRRYELDPG